MEIVPSTPVRPRRTGRLALGVLAGVLVVLGLVGAFPVLMGMERVGMADDAMGSEVPRGSYVLVRRVAAQDVRVGDLVSFRDPVRGRPVVRRVATVDGGWLELTGDVAGTEPATVRAVRVRAVVRHVPWAGYPMMALPAWPAPYLVAGMLGALLLAGLRVSDERRRRRPPVLASIVIPRQASAPESAPESVPRSVPSPVPSPVPGSVPVLGVVPNAVPAPTPRADVTTA